MELRLTYQEISDLIEKKAGKSLPIVYGGPHTVRVSYDVNVLFKSTSIGLDLTVERVENNDIVLSYDGGAGIDFMIRQAISMAKSRPGGEFIDSLGGNMICIALCRNQQAGTIFDHVDLKDIRFDEQYVIIEFVPKTDVGLTV
ncbi:MAG: hypothetical protein J6W88_04690 [Bacteroidales bacterium]|nr:hypothetical protein [Bacteroidales bacterium]